MVFADRDACLIWNFSRAKISEPCAWSSHADVDHALRLSKLQNHEEEMNKRKPCWGVCYDSGEYEEWTRADIELGRFLAAELAIQLLDEKASQAVCENLPPKIKAKVPLKLPPALAFKTQLDFHKLEHYSHIHGLYKLEHLVAA